MTNKGSPINITVPQPIVHSFEWDDLRLEAGQSQYSCRTRIGGVHKDYLWDRSTVCLLWAERR